MRRLEPSDGSNPGPRSEWLETSELPAHARTLRAGVSVPDEGRATGSEHDELNEGSAARIPAAQIPAAQIPAARIAVVIPCYREREHILATLERVPDRVWRIYCVDDACPDGTGDLVEARSIDARVEVLRNETNTGVGGATVEGYRRALADGADVIVKIDGDGQMDPALLPGFVRPVLEGRADYTKGNRFYRLENLRAMPRRRIVGNALLSFSSKLSSGYWRVFDPTNGYTAIDARVLRLLPLEKLHRGWFFESDMLFHLGVARAVVEDVPQRAIYGNETSHIRIGRCVPVFAYHHAKSFLSRLFYTYVLRDFQLASIEWALGPLLILFALVFGSWRWYESVAHGHEATAGTVMLSALPFLVGLQLLLSAVGFDVDNQPRTPISRHLSPTETWEPAEE